MASVQYSLGSFLSQKRNFKPLSIVQPGNARHSINLVTKQANSIATFSQLSIGEKHSNYGSKTKVDQWKVCCSNDGSSGIDPHGYTPSVLHLIQDFYSSINDKDTQKLDQLLSHDCWKGIEIPFTTGRNCFEYQEVGEKLIISKITGMEEFPVIPGDLVLKLLKAVVSVFDSFPFADEQLLTRSQGTHEGIIKLLEMLAAYKKN